MKILLISKIKTVTKKAITETEIIGGKIKSGEKIGFKTSAKKSNISLT